MANADLVALVHQGKEAFLAWRKVNPDAIVDFAHSDFQGYDFVGWELGNINFSHSNLEGAKFDNVEFRGSNFQNAMLTGATFRGAKSTEGSISFGNAELDRCDFGRTLFLNSDFTSSDSTGANFQNALLVGSRWYAATFINADFSCADLLRANFDMADLSGSKLDSADLSRATFDRTKLNNCSISKANFFEAMCNRGEWEDVRGLQLAKGLETITASEDPLYLENCERHWLDRCCDWERLRTFGRMPLFGLSYSVLILIPIYIYGLAWYNTQIDKLQLGQATGEWSLVQHLQPMPLPSRSLILLISTILLAIASTLYTLFCPSRIREFTKDVWCDQLNRSLLNYWPLAWRYPGVRALCGACYVVGGFGALYVLVAKIATAGAYIWRHSAGIS
ncbi:pentapeptide repeat-containing protein [Gemmata sp.]|uniref:pentapeptide repeat-containing protein n=1 Tax=Gemmata sp. TaxID=1914242 RepID=UPI003F701C7A